jgi:hypothetical protein
MAQHLPAPRYNLGDHVAVQTDEWSADGKFHGVVHACAWNGSTGDHIYTIEVPQRGGEESALMVVHEHEISGLA